MNDNQLSIRLDGMQVGILEQTAQGKMRFTYDSTYYNPLLPISVGMPVRKEPYDDQACTAYFGGLLPENNETRKVLGKIYGINANNHFALLKAIGYDCAGAISCQAIDEPEEEPRAIPLMGRILSDEELYEHIKELPQKPLFTNVDGLRLSLAGAQDKAAICLIDNQIAIAENGCPTTHILKPASQRFDGLAENEYFCMKIAKRIGLKVPDVELREVNGLSFVLIERYDRIIHENHVIRLHQEDFCQALGVSTDKKYQNEGGPNFKDCFELLNTIGANSNTSSIISRDRLVSALVFNYLIGNTDAHGKNFSLLYPPTKTKDLRLWSAPQFAPLYDLVCTLAYPSLTNKMAMKIGSQYEADLVFPRHWETLCKEIRYSYPAMKSLIERMAEEILQAAAVEKQKLEAAGYKIAIIEKIMNVVEKNIKNTLDKFIPRI